MEEGLMTRKQQEEAEAKLQKMQTELQDKTRAIDQELVKKEREYTKPMYARFEKALQQVAKENKYDYIIEKQFILGMANSIDATAKVKAALGM